ncbi:hypothetical protein BDN67DRAFT_983812 [Paxillus ammoniavirescens]|nr:hypothetical protein BDN67DRAFT_983812 [Paxillus ammoniavirescens]
MPPKLNDLRQASAYKVAGEPKLLELLSDSLVPVSRVKFIGGLQSIMDAAGAPAGKADIFSDFIDTVGELYATKPGLAPLQPLFSAWLAFKAAKAQSGVRRRQLITCLGLSPASKDHKARLAVVQTHFLPALAKPYPPEGFWWYESDVIRDAWYDHLSFGKQPDQQLKRHPLCPVDPGRLQLQIPAGESAIIRDAETEEVVMVVMQNFCEDADVLSWVDGKVRKVVGHKRSVRDPGKIPSSIGQKNLLTKKLPPSTASALDSDTTSVCALFWNLARSRLPDEILDDFDRWFKSSGIVRMGGDPKLQEMKPTGEYSIGLGSGLPGERVNFQGVELAPPAGVFAQNYCRAGHSEHQPHKYGLAWTTGRVGGLERGGHFYNSKYGIAVQSASNTMVVWTPEHEHGTSLQLRKIWEADPDFRQTGVAFVTSNRLTSTWCKYRDGLLAHAEAQALLDAGGSSDEENK